MSPRWSIPRWSIVIFWGIVILISTVASVGFIELLAYLWPEYNECLVCFGVFGCIAIAVGFVYVGSVIEKILY